MSNFAEMYYTNSIDRLDELILSATKKKDEITRQKIMALSDDAFIKYIANNLIACMAFVNAIRYNQTTLGTLGYDDTDIQYSFDWFKDKIPNYLYHLFDGNKEEFNLSCLCSVGFCYNGLNIWLIDAEVDYLDEWSYQEFYHVNSGATWLADIFERLIVNQLDLILESSNLYSEFRDNVIDFREVMIQKGYDSKYACLLTKDQQAEMVNCYLDYLKNKEENTSAR